MDTPVTSDLRDCPACFRAQSQQITKTWNGAKANQNRIFVEWQCQNKACLRRMYDNYPIPAYYGPSLSPSSEVVTLNDFSYTEHDILDSGPGLVCPRCSERAGKLAEIGGEELCPRCTAEINAGCDQRRDPTGQMRQIPTNDPKNAPHHKEGWIGRGGCELCHKIGGTLIFFEGVWICKDCRKVCEEGEYVLSQLKKD